MMGFLGSVSLYFPEDVDPAFLYPETSAKYTGPQGTYDVPCTIPGAVEIPETSCPDPFVTPLAVDSVVPCIQACPVQAYDDNEYTAMWATSNGVGIIGFALNLFMACTWFIAGKQHLSDQPFQLKWCIFAGLVYGLVATFPSLILKYGLPCECETEECTGTSVLCMINRLSVYILLSILINLCALTYQIASALIGATGHKNKATLNLMTTVVSILMAVLGIALEGDVFNDTHNMLLMKGTPRPPGRN